MENENERLGYFHFYVSIHIGAGGEIANGKTFYNTDTRC